MKNGAMGKIRRMALVIGLSMMSILPAGSAFAAVGNQVLMVAPAPVSTPVREIRQMERCTGRLHR